MQHYLLVLAPALFVLGLVLGLALFGLALLGLWRGDRAEVGLLLMVSNSLHNINITPN